MFRQRLRLWFAKEGLLRFISHHDLMRLFERALRRSGLPLKLSEGFNPRPVMSFASALALGVESRGECAEVELTEWVSPTRALRDVARRMPDGIRVFNVQSVGYGEKAEVVQAEYSVRLGLVPEDLPSKLGAFMDSSSATVERLTKSGVKSVDVRGFVRDLKLDGDTVRMILDVSPAGSVRPEEVLEALLKGPVRTLAPLMTIRTRLRLSAPLSSQGESK